MFFVFTATMNVPVIAESTSNAAAKLQIRGIAGFNRRYPSPKPRPYIVQITRSATKGPSTGSAPKRKEIPNVVKKIHITSAKVKPRLEYERRIITKHIDVASAAPPFPKIENSGKEKLLTSSWIPRLSFPCFMLICSETFVSPEKKAEIRGHTEA